MVRNEIINAFEKNKFSLLKNDQSWIYSILFHMNQSAVDQRDFGFFFITTKRYIGKS